MLINFLNLCGGERMHIITEDPRRSGRRAILSLRIWLLTEAANAVLAMLAISGVGGFPGSIEDDVPTSIADLVTDGMLLVGIVAYLAAAGFVLRWIYVATRNANALSDQMVVTPGWAVGRFFVPVLNLWKPFQGLAETWRATVAPTAPDSVPTPALLRWWWGLWLASSLYDTIGARIALKADTSKELVDAGWIDILRLVIDVPLVIVLVRIITQLSMMQSQRLATSPMPIRTDDDSI